MTTQQVADRLYELCEKNDSARAREELYSPDITSTEQNMQGSRETLKGLPALEEKSKNFQAMIEAMYGGYTNKPTVFGNFIFMEMGMDAKMKGMDRFNMVEMCRYEVKDGKIIAEEFYY